jgi:A/G-specific adenine glycosylase
MLQQTRVEAVKGYYARFLAALPNVAMLADADDDLLHKLWEGLGYYSRVRNLKKAARLIMTEHGGVFPGEYAQVLALPGIGEYTAGAICSIAFEQQVPAVDGNVLRVMSRLTDDSTPVDDPKQKRKIQAALAEIYPQRAGDFTQALMELGATLCGPNRKPACQDCPCSGFCLGYLRGTAQSLPVKAPKKARRVEDHTVFILSCDGKIGLEKRKNRGLLAGLWQFPNVPGRLETDEALKVVQQMGLRPVEVYRQVERRHIFTHIEWRMRGIYLEVGETAGNLIWTTGQQIREQAALPTAFRQFWEEIDHV